MSTTMADLANMCIPQIAPFIPDADPTSVAQRWRRWSDRFDNLIIALNITDAARKKALLLHLAGEVYDVFQGLIVADVANEADPAVDNVYINTNAHLIHTLTRKETQNSKSTRSENHGNRKIKHYTYLLKEDVKCFGLSLEETQVESWGPT